MLNKIELAMQLASCAPDSIVRSDWTVLVKGKNVRATGEECLFHFAGRVLLGKRTTDDLYRIVYRPTSDARARLIKDALAHYDNPGRSVLSIEPYRESRCATCSRTRVGPQMLRRYGPKLYRNTKWEVPDGE